MTLQSISTSSLALEEPPSRRLEHGEIERLAGRFEGRSPQALLAWALERFGRRLVICTSFQADGMVVLDMAWRLDPQVRVITIDTGRLPPETFELIDRVRARYDLEVEIFCPEAAAVEALVRRGGPNLFYDSVDSRLACCRVRKVEPLKRALAGADAWVTGLRRDQSPSRARIRKVELDHVHGGIVKLNPLASWTWGDVWSYVDQHRVPYHKLYGRGYASIGCAPCTRPVRPGETARAGRWWWENGDHKECGLHLPALVPIRGRGTAGRRAGGAS
ncbi:MAG: phosphoadenylyl-sulfate reductase [Acidobacteria bacterium]|nr:MAG: phosphoadenylyl-sulfate reductase [Acidobacteriota bacterium]